MDQFTNNLSTRGNAIEGSAIRSILAIAGQPGIISFAGGLPSDEAIPESLIATIARDVLHNSKQSALQYTATEGLLHFRTYLCDWINNRYKTIYTPDETLITSGSQQAIDLAAEVLLNPGDIVIVERPTYLAALQIFKKIGATLIEADCDDNGMIPESVEKILKSQAVKLIYTIPDHQNPSGVEMTEERRKDLATLALSYTVPLFEDGAYREIRFTGTPLRPIASFDTKNEMVLLAQTASKILSPGLRVGWIQGPKALINKMALLKQSVDVHTSGLTQEIVYHYLADGHFQKQLPAIAKLYNEHATAMNVALKIYGKNMFEWQMPKGGMFIWAKAKGDVNTSDCLMDIVTNSKVAYVPGATFYAQNPEKQTLRLNFSKSSPEQIDKGIKSLSEAFSDLARRPLAEVARGRL